MISNKEKLQFAALAFLPAVLLAAPLRCQKTVNIKLIAKEGLVQIAPGRTVKAWLFNGQLPGPTIRVTEGDRVRITVRNELPEVTTVHWHGLAIGLFADGVPGASQAPIGIGQEYRYEFTAPEAGSYWYHPHVGLQLDRGLVAPLIIEPRNKKDDPPFDVEHIVLLDDWLPAAPVAGRDPVYSDFLINGRTSAGQRELVVKKGQRVRIRFINASGATNYAVSIDGHPMTVSHADGRPVRPVVTRAIPMGPGERYDVYFTANNPGKWSIAAADMMRRNVTLVRAVLAYSGSNAKVPPPSYNPPDLRSAPLLSYAQLASLLPAATTATPNRVHSLTLGWGGRRRYIWTINGQVFPNVTPLDVRTGERVRFDMFNRTPHPHPMHIHGHFFRIYGSAGGTTHALVKDTMLIPGHMGRGSFEITADNPGNWAYHCHNAYHMEAGMMRLVRYIGSDLDGDGLFDGADFDPHAAYAATWVSDLRGGFRPGSLVGVHGQWPAGESLLWFAGPELPKKISLGAIGLLAINPILSIGSARTGAGQQATLQLPVPNDARLSGLRIALQSAATRSTLSPGLRLSHPTTLEIR